LEPYAAQISPAAPIPEKVPDSAISLEKLVWTPGQPLTGLPGQPEWAASLGLDIGEQPKEKGEPIPDWLAEQGAKTGVFEAETPAGEGIPPFAEQEKQPPAPEPEEAEDQIPDWMKTAGWGPTSSEEAEEPATLFEDSGIEFPGEEVIAPAEIPDWLQAIAPQEMAIEEEPVEQAEIEPPGEAEPAESDALSWLQESEPGPTDSVVTWLEDTQSPTPKSTPFEPEEKKEAEAEIPEWLKDLGEAEPATPESIETEHLEPMPEAEIEPQEAGTAELPAWLAESQPVTKETPAEELPDWLKLEGEKPAEEAEATSPDWLQETRKEEEPSPVEVESAVTESLVEPAEPVKTTSDEDEAFAWLESLAAKQGAEEALLLTPEERREEPPEWIKEAAGAQPPIPEPAAPAEKEATLPEWLQEEPRAEAEAGTGEARPEWLSEFERLSSPETEGTRAEEPSLQVDFGAAEELPALAGEEEPLELEEELPEAEPGELPEWLREAAGEVSEAAEPSLLIEESQGIEPPAKPEVEVPFGEGDEITEAQPGELPEWLREAAGEVSVAAEPSMLTEEAQGIELPAEPEVEEPSSEEREITEAQPGELPEWLREAAGEVSEEAEPAIAAEEARGFELPVEAEFGEPVSKVEEVSEAEPGELPAWLREAAERELEAAESPMVTGAGEGIELPAEPELEAPFAQTEELPVAEAGELPDWLQASGEAERAPEVPGVTETAPAGELPTWLAPAEVEPETEMLFGPQALSTEVISTVEETPPAAVEELHLEEPEAPPISDTQPTRVQPAEAVVVPEEAEIPLPPTTPLSPQVPDWLKDLSEEEVVPEAMPEPKPEIGGKPLDDEAAFAWLEGLAARMGAEEALLLSPEERAEEPPEWIVKAAEEAEQPLETPTSIGETTPTQVRLPEEVVEEVLPVEEVPEEIPAMEGVSLEPAIEEFQPPVAEEAPIEIEELPVEPVEERFIAEVEELPTIEEPPIPVAEVELPAVEVEAEEMPAVEPVVEIEEPEAPLPVTAEYFPSEEIPLSFEPEPGESIEEARVEREAEPPPELPSWLAGIEAVEAIQEEAEWTPPEEAKMEEAVEAMPSESLVFAEPFQLAGTEMAQLDINQAGLSELERIPGMGFIRAQAILTYRQAFGPFSSVDELINVSGFDQDLIDGLKSRLTIGEVQPVEPLAAGVDIHQLTLIQARNALISGDSGKALVHYTSLIKARQLLPEVIQDLNEALYRFPVEVPIWEALGDAQMRVGHLQEALDAYTKAEELIR
jgi:competence ComEA-like helix-hairpin-helix protein